VDYGSEKKSVKRKIQQKINVLYATSLSRYYLDLFIKHRNRQNEEITVYTKIVTGKPDPSHLPILIITWNYLFTNKTHSSVPRMVSLYEPSFLTTQGSNYKVGDLKKPFVFSISSNFFGHHFLSLSHFKRYAILSMALFCSL